LLPFVLTYHRLFTNSNKSKTITTMIAISSIQVMASLLRQLCDIRRDPPFVSGLAADRCRGSVVTTAAYHWPPFSWHPLTFRT
jgi:hypothetical protein